MVREYKYGVLYFIYKERERVQLKRVLQCCAVLCCVPILCSH